MIFDTSNLNIAWNTISAKSTCGQSKYKALLYAVIRDRTQIKLLSENLQKSRANRNICVYETFVDYGNGCGQNKTQTWTSS